MHAVESAPTFSFSSSWEEVFADFEEMARLIVEEKNMAYSSRFFEQETERKSLINVSNVVRRTSEACLVSESTIKRYRWG